VKVDEWEQHIAAFSERFTLEPSDSATWVDELDALAVLCPASDGRSDFERAGIRDSTGRTAAAVEYYEAGVASGLDDVRTARTFVQLASSKRVIGELHSALALIERADLHALGGAPSVVRALILHDLGRDDEALRVAIEGLVPHLPRYQRSMANYARLLTEPEEVETEDPRDLV
jgi:hypothetical protein